MSEGHKYAECDNASPDLTTIYLQPRCACDPYGEGRMWCEDPQDPCENCGAEWIKFARVVAARSHGRVTASKRPSRR